MKNINDTSENYGKCLHSAIYTPNNDELIYRKAYVGDWGDWDEQPETEISDSGFDFISDENLI